jgi:16S rRNA (guanine527-N7)-methyltransferase
MRFHVEHSILHKWIVEHDIHLNETRIRKLADYAELIQETNKKFNITGFKTTDEIMKNLIIGSIDPFVSLNVPRGTIFADIGTGAGIPGIPLAIYNDNWNGVCIDSNSKKVSFVDSVIRECGIGNLEVYNGRLEDLARKQMRNCFDYVFSRALGEIYFVLEVGAPLLKGGGLLFVYSHTGPEDLHLHVIDHAAELGLSLLERYRYGEYGIKDTGIIFIKTGVTNEKYPRTMTVIKRDIQRKLKVS